MTCWLALTAVTAYLLDAAWGGVHAWASLGAAVVVSGAITILIPREPKISVADLTVWLGIVVFIALLAVKPGASGQGLGGALVAHVAARAFARRRWLFVSCDADNRAALRFYRRQGFARVGRLPDLVSAGRIELLLRKARPATGSV